MKPYFFGMYFLSRSHRQALALIPSVHRTKSARFCAVQLVTGDRAFYVRFPYPAFQRLENGICIAENRFGSDGIDLALHSAQLDAFGSLRFGPPCEIRGDIMGPFRYVPFLQCRHSVYSMRHRVDGTLYVNGTPYAFDDGVGYTEGDRGRSFPKEYAWTQCSFHGGALMLSVADIPIGPLHFTGIIGVVLLNGKEYRLATYSGAKAEQISADEIRVRQGQLLLRVMPHKTDGHPLRAPIGGAMERIVREHPACEVSYRFESGGKALLSLDAADAAFEYAYCAGSSDEQS